MDDLDHANLFLSAVSNMVFGPVKAEVRNEIIRWGTAAKDLSLMDHYLFRYIVPTQRMKSPYGAVFVTLGEQKCRPR
jgi:hypothetical protein